MLQIKRELMNSRSQSRRHHFLSSLSPSLCRSLCVTLSVSLSLRLTLSVSLSVVCSLPQFFRVCKNLSESETTSSSMKSMLRIPVSSIGSRVVGLACTRYRRGSKMGSKCIDDLMNRCGPSISGLELWSIWLLGCSQFATILAVRKWIF